MATQSQKSDIVTEIWQATTELLAVIDRIEVLNTSWLALGLDAAGADPLMDADLQGENAGLTAANMADAIYAVSLVQQHLDTLDRAAFERVRTGW